MSVNNVPATRKQQVTTGRSLCYCNQLWDFAPVMSLKVNALTANDHVSK